MLRYSTDTSLTVAQFRDLLVRSTLAERRPVNDDDCLSQMLQHANILVTCWDGDRLVGVARSVSDFSFCCYLSDLAVDEAYQKKGIGTELIRATQRQLGPRCKLILLAAPLAADYYPRLGFEHNPRCWTSDRPI